MKARAEHAAEETGFRCRKDFPMVKKESTWDRDLSERTHLLYRRTW